MIKIFRLILPSIVAIYEAIDSVDAKIVSADGLKILSDPKKLNKLNKNIEEGKFYI